MSTEQPRQEPPPGRRIMERRAAQNQYLHKDFHVALHHALEYVEDRFGPAGMEQYLRQAARAMYGPLAESIRTRGLPALRQHLQDIFTAEQADFALNLSGEELVLELASCPALAHLRAAGLAPHERFCRATQIVNDALADMAGLDCRVEHDAGAGRCVQTWRLRRQ